MNLENGCVKWLKKKQQKKKKQLVKRIWEGSVAQIAFKKVLGWESAQEMSKVQACCSGRHNSCCL